MGNVEEFNTIYSSIEIKHWGFCPVFLANKLEWKNDEIPNNKIFKKKLILLNYLTILDDALQWPKYQQNKEFLYIIVLIIHQFDFSFDY